MRYAIRIEAHWYPFLLLSFVTRKRAFVDLGNRELHFRFGDFSEIIPLDEVSEGHHARWSILWGIGRSLGPKNGIGLIGSTRGVVEVRFRSPRKVRVLGIPVLRGRIYASLEHPNDFLDRLRDLIASR